MTIITIDHSKDIRLYINLDNVAAIKTMKRSEDVGGGVLVDIAFTGGDAKTLSGGAADEFMTKFDKYLINEFNKGRRTHD